MKKLMSLVALAVVGSVVASSAAEVYSANAVGYVKRKVPAGGLQIVSVPFDNVSGESATYKFGETQVADDMPAGSAALFWDANNQKWVEANKSARQGWGGFADRELAVGEPFFLRNNTTGDIYVTSAGEVPSAGTLTRAYAGENGLSFAADPYPVDKPFGETEIAEALPPGSSAMFWDADNQKWVEANKSARQGWGGFASRMLEAGEGFFVRTATEGTWVAVKPYEWP